MRAEGHRLELGEDADGLRYFLDGRPVHSGTPLELLIPILPRLAHIWAPVRFELDREARSPIFYFWLGEDIGNIRMELPENAVLRWPEGSAR